MKDNTKCSKISDIDIDKIRVSDEKLYIKDYNLYKRYVFYKHNNEYIPLRIILKDVVGYYNDYTDSSEYDVKYSAKRTYFRFNDSMVKFYDIFEHIEEKLGTDLNNFTYESIRDEEYLKTSVSDEKCFRKNNYNRIPSENTKCTCRVLLIILSVYINMKDNKDNIKYYPQVLLEQCVYKYFSNNTIVHQDLEFTNTKPDSESEEEINENTTFDE